MANSKLLNSTLNKWLNVMEMIYVIVYLFWNIFSIFMTALACTFIQRDGCIDSNSFLFLYYQFIAEIIGCFIWGFFTYFHPKKDTKSLGTVLATIITMIFSSMIGFRLCWDHSMIQKDVFFNI